MPVTLAAVVEAASAAGLLDSRTAQRVLAEGPQRRMDPVRTVSRIARVPSASLYHALATARGMPFLGPAALLDAQPVVERVAPALLRRRRFLPLRDRALGAVVAVCDPDDREAIDAARAALETAPRPALADPDDIDAALDHALGSSGVRSAPAPQRDVVAFLDDIVEEALLRRASDIHVEPGPDGARIRLRVDGDLQLVRGRVGADLAAALVSRVKVLAGLDIAESREPQDGGFSRRSTDGAGVIDVRVATAPTRFGERATLRLLGVDAGPQRLDDLGLAPDVLAAFRRALGRPSGLVLLTGATGSGKSTTLYAALRELRDPRRNILTVEDPIESHVEGVSQIQVDSAGKVTFSRALRSLLRHDPDVLMVGEIRDRETLEIALRAAMTGHLVLSTLHTRSACGAVARLRDMGAEPYQIASTLVAVVAQTLLRRLCAACRRSRAATAEEARALGGPSHVHEPVGCALCTGSGHRGRIAVAEALPIEGEVRRLVAADADEEAIRTAAQDAGLRTLAHDARAKVTAGVVGPADGIWEDA